VSKLDDRSGLGDIQEVNLSYLLLAQRLLRENFSVGMFRLGCSEQVGRVLLDLSPAQLVRLAGSSGLICGFRLDDYQLLSALTQDVLGGVLQQAHSTILLSQQTPEAMVSNVRMDDMPAVTTAPATGSSVTHTDAAFA